MVASSTIRLWWNAWRCQPARLTNYLFYGKPIGGVATETVDAYKALESVLKAHDYKPSSVWAYNCRKVAGTTTWSLHSYGLAVDIDPRENPYSDGDSFDPSTFTPELIADVEKIRSVNGSQVWQWGGRWGKPDRMHFQINVAPDDCVIDWSTVEDDVAQFTEDEARELKEFLGAIHRVGSNVNFVVPSVKISRILKEDDPDLGIPEIIGGVPGTVDAEARAELDALKETLRSV